MQLNGADKILEYFIQLQTTFAVIFGMCVQFIFGEAKTVKVFTLILASSLFIALYIMPIFINWINHLPGVNIVPGSDIYNGLYALSALLSMELLALIVTILPKAIGNRVKAALGVKND